VDGGIVLYCGDGIQSGAEECDRGAENDDATYGGCTSRCFYGPYCGDGIVNGAEEECDLGDANGRVFGEGGCTVGCKKTPYCGDGIVDPREDCDLGERNGMTLDRNENPSSEEGAAVFCTRDCSAPVCCVF
jgi:hypothetical protein